MKLIMHYVAKVWPVFLLSILCVCLEALADLLQPSLLSDIVDVGIANGDMGYVLRTAGIMVAIVALTGFTAVGRTTFSSMGSERIGFYLRADLYRKIQTLAPEELDRALREKLPVYMLPNRYHPRERLPMTLNDKIDRVALKRRMNEMN